MNKQLNFGNSKGLVINDININFIRHRRAASFYRLSDLESESDDINYLDSTIFEIGPSRMLLSYSVDRGEECPSSLLMA